MPSVAHQLDLSIFLVSCCSGFRWSNWLCTSLKGVFPITCFGVFLSPHTMLSSFSVQFCQRRFTIFFNSDNIYLWEYSNWLFVWGRCTDVKRCSMCSFSLSHYISFQQSWGPLSVMRILRRICWSYRVLLPGILWWRKGFDFDPYGEVVCCYFDLGHLPCANMEGYKQVNVSLWRKVSRLWLGSSLLAFVRYLVRIFNRTRISTLSSWFICSWWASVGELS